MARSEETLRLAGWLQSRGGVVHEALELFARRPSGLRGVFALARIPCGTLLLRLPRSAVLSLCDGDPLWMPRSTGDMSAVLRTALYLLREMAHGSASEWAPYIASLPNEYNTLDSWSSEEIEALRGTAVYDELAELRDVRTGHPVGPARVLWDRSIAPLVAQFQHLWPDASFDSFLHACATVRTRGFFDTAGTGGPYMLPAIDMLNHSRAGTATSLVVERDGDMLVFSMEAERDVEAGEELTHMYDHFDDAQLLLTYGFISSPGEGVLPSTARITLQAIADSTAKVLADSTNQSGRESWAAKLVACKQLLSAHGGKVGVTVVEPLPDELFTATLLLLLPSSDFEAVLLEGGCIDDEAPSSIPLLDRTLLRGEPALAAAVAEAISGAVEQTLIRYANEDETTAQSCSCSARRFEMAKSLKEAERAALLETQKKAFTLLELVRSGGSNASDIESGTEESTDQLEMTIDS